MSKLILVLGGIRSGKSRFAEKLASTAKNVTYIATAQAADEEMKQRIAEHQKRRPSHWQTIEAGKKTLGDCLDNCKTDTVLIDCLGNLINKKGVQKDLDSKRDKFNQIIIVSNEVGLSLVSPYESGRQFSDCLGLLNQEIAAIANEVHLVIAGIPIKIK